MTTSSVCEPQLIQNKKKKDKNRKNTNFPELGATRTEEAVYTFAVSFSSLRKTYQKEADGLEKDKINTSNAKPAIQ